MAGWLSVLKVVPWADVIAAAPKIAAGARKLWDNVGRGAPEAAETAPFMAKEPMGDPGAALAARLDQADAAVADLQRKLVSATELIATLADQNEQLIVRIDGLRVRLLWVAGGSCIALLLAISALIAART